MKRPTSLILAAALAATAIITIDASSQPQVAEAAICPDVRVLWVRGTGVNINNDPHRDFYLSEIKWRARQGARIDSISIPYPAMPDDISVEDFWSELPRTAERVDQYNASVFDGVQRLYSEVRATQSNCPSAAIVLAGHSQGANVVGDYVQTHGTGGAIIQAQLFGDPRFNGGDPASAGNAVAAGVVEGIAAMVHNLDSYFPNYRPYFRNSEVRSWCNDNDPVCDKPSYYWQIDDRFPNHLLAAYKPWYREAANLLQPLIDVKLTKMGVHGSDMVWAAKNGIDIGCTDNQGWISCSAAPMKRIQMAETLSNAVGLSPINGSSFTDIGSYKLSEQGYVYAIAQRGITKGCNPPTNTKYCPTDTVTREQMASFLSRAFSIPTSSTQRFTDVTSTNVHFKQINGIAVAGITLGCNPPYNTKYCPKDNVTQGQMASFIRRAKT